MEKERVLTELQLHCYEIFEKKIYSGINSGHLLVGSQQ